MTGGWFVLSSSIIAVFCIALGQNAENATNAAGRKEKALSVFTVVKFPNTVCTSSTSGRNGTCYTASECSSKSGTSSGSCASSFGVCCVFEKSCGAGSIAENCTYFTSTDRTVGSQCTINICKCSTDVCQLRLDFETFAMNSPVTVTTVTFGPGTAAAGTANSLGACTTDTFQVTTCGAKSPPLICGTNTGEHMYVAACDNCNTLNANFGSTSTAGTTAFTIKVTQIPCNSKMKAPSGCLQYFTGTTGTINTYNYNSGGGQLLTNQDYSACIRSERTICAICYYSTIFKLSLPGAIATLGSTGVDTNCGIPALISPTFVNGGAYDYIQIPDGQCDSPVSNAVTTANEANDRYCGTIFYCMTGAGTTTAATSSQTVCSHNRPFKIAVHSDGLEYAFPATASEGLSASNLGFSIGYYQKTNCLTRPAA